MESMVLLVPKMWADHHVLAVRRALLALPGVQELEASAAHTRIRISFDPALVGRSQIEQTLREAGYDPAEPLSFPEPLPNKEQASAWFVQGIRTTQTNQLDLDMSGDFRKY